MPDSRYASLRIDSTEELFRRFMDLNKWQTWLFRGQPCNKALASTLERAAIESRIDLSELPTIEDALIRDFSRKYSESDRQLVETDTLYCLSRMQHYGGPTRLVDFTYSIWVALFFALERAPEDGDKAIIWCINGDWSNPTDDKRITRRSHEEVRRADKSFRDIYMQENSGVPPAVHHENPHNLHARLIIQQGVFICPTTITKRLDDVLSGIEGSESENNVLKIEISPDCRKDLLRWLRRMNISRASLFPGLDGFTSAYNLDLDHFKWVAARRSQKQ